MFGLSAGECIMSTRVLAIIDRLLSILRENHRCLEHLTHTGDCPLRLKGPIVCVREKQLWCLSACVGQSWFWSKRSVCVYVWNASLSSGDTGRRKAVHGRRQELRGGGYLCAPAPLCCVGSFGDYSAAEFSSSHSEVLFQRCSPTKPSC